MTRTKQDCLHSSKHYRIHSVLFSINWSCLIEFLFNCYSLCIKLVITFCFSRVRLCELWPIFLKMYFLNRIDLTKDTTCSTSYMVIAIVTYPRKIECTQVLALYTTLPTRGGKIVSKKPLVQTNQNNNFL